MREKLKVVSVFPDLLGTYGDSGNSLVLARRLALRGFDVSLITVGVRDTVPSDGDFYLMGGGEDGPQAKAAELLKLESPLQKGLDKGAALLAVCAGFQILGESFLGPDSQPRTGVGIFATITHRSEGPRSVGELVVDPFLGKGVPLLTGYENHQGVTELLGDAAPLGNVLIGCGNNYGPKVDGAVSGKAVGTYLHGPVLARNPRLCDYLISSVIGEVEPIGEKELEHAHELLYEERIKAATA